MRDERKTRMEGAGMEPVQSAHVYCPEGLFPFNATKVLTRTQSTY